MIFVVRLIQYSCMTAVVVAPKNWELQNHSFPHGRCCALCTKVCSTCESSSPAEPSRSDSCDADRNCHRIIGIFVMRRGEQIWEPWTPIYLSKWLRPFTFHITTDRCDRMHLHPQGIMGNSYLIGKAKVFVAGRNSPIKVEHLPS